MAFAKDRDKYLGTHKHSIQGIFNMYKLDLLGLLKSLDMKEFEATYELIINTFASIYQNNTAICIASPALAYPMSNLAG